MRRLSIILVLVSIFVMVSSLSFAGPKKSISKPRSDQRLFSTGPSAPRDADRDGYISVKLGGDDCNDYDAAIHPSAIEVCGDSIDQDCSGADLVCDYDADNDGYDAVEFGGNDCNDNDAAIHPNAQEICGDTIDQDCSGADLQCQDNICEATDGAHCYYISPGGNDSNDGSINAPFASTNRIINSINPGDFIYFRGGSYGPAAKGQIYESGYPPYFPTVALITRSGTSGHPITFKAYPGELPVLDMYAINPEFNPNSFGHPINNPVHSPDNAFQLNGADYIVISGFEIVHGCIFVYGSDYTWVENNHIHDVITDRDNNGLVMLYFTEHAYVRNNNIHDTYSRSIPDGNGGWMLNTTKDHYDRAHNGGITTLSGDIYEGYGVESSGPFEITNNEIHDCPVHLFIKNPQGELVDSNGINMLIKNNYFYGAGILAEWFEASNVVFENNLFKDIDGIAGMGQEEVIGEGAMLNEITARNVTFRNNVFTSISGRVVQMFGLGFLMENGVYSTAMEDKLKFHNNVVVMDGAVSSPGAMGWNQLGYIFSNTYAGMVDPQVTPSKTLSRIDSADNCYINQLGDNVAFLKHWYNGYETITGYSHSTAQTMYNINGAGDLFPSDISLSTHFTDPENNDFSVKNDSPCSEIPNVGLLHPEIFVH